MREVPGSIPGRAQQGIFAFYLEIPSVREWGSESFFNFVYCALSQFKLDVKKKKVNDSNWLVGLGV